jgi:hypothetical protein
MTMLERPIDSAASAVGADPEDLRGLARGATLREWPQADWLFYESTLYNSWPARRRTPSLHPRQWIDDLRGCDPRQCPHTHRRATLGDHACSPGSPPTSARPQARRPRGVGQTTRPAFRSHDPSRRKDPGCGNVAEGSGGVPGAATLSPLAGAGSDWDRRR